MIICLNDVLDDLDKTTIKFNGSVLWLPKLDNYICAFRAIKKPFYKNIQDSPNYPYMWIDQKYWYNNYNYIGLILLDKNLKPHKKTFRKYHHTFKDLDLIELKSKGISYSGPEDPRLYFKTDGQPYMLYNTIIPENLIENCKKQCVGMYEIQIKPKYFTEFKNTELFLKNDKKILCLNVLDKLAIKNGIATIKNIIPSNEINKKVDYLIDNLNHYKIIYENKDNGMCEATNNKNVDDIVLPENLKNIFDEQLRDKITTSLTSPEIRLNKNKEEFLGVAHIRIKYKYLLKNIKNLNTDFLQFLLILTSRVENKYIQHTDFYTMLFYLRNKDGNIISYSKPFIPIASNIEKNKQIFYNVNFTTGITRKEDEILVSYGKGDCLLNLLKLNKKYIEKILIKNKKLILNDFSINKYTSLEKNNDFVNLENKLKRFSKRISMLIKKQILPY
tara:strand:- start:61 stop:1395 length:1335 start_codon:yes stop_codon:yes gene_type:complete